MTHVLPATTHSLALTYVRFLFGGALILTAHVLWATDGEPLPAEIRFGEHIRPIFARNCASCHGGVKRASGVSFSYRDQVITVGDSGETVVVPGDPDASYLIERITETDPDFRMPPVEHGPPLMAREIALIKDWIRQGATWDKHWAFETPLQQDAPEVRDADWSKVPLDRFVLARLEQEGLRPSPVADRRQWLRRVSLDLTGLPPSPKEVGEYLADASPESAERVVDRLLASPHFGERWAAVWLDLSRYADTKGYEKDPPRTVWPYRDWLIRAFNADMPFDEFTIKQLAGDLLPDASLEDLIATVFHRNTQNNTEGGTDDEEFRIAAVIDRVNTTWEVWQATTFRCVQCHSHPYDPIENHEFYSFLAFFNTSEDADLDDDAPLLKVPEDWDELPAADALFDRMREIQSTLHDRVMPLAHDTGQWNYLTANRAKSTGSTELSIKSSPEGGSEVWAGGTITSNSKFEIDFTLPENLSHITALRIDALPKDLEAALRIPEKGLAVTRLRAEIIDKGDQILQEVPLKVGFCDDPHPQYDATDSLQDNNQGWSLLTRIYRPRFAVFIAENPVDTSAGEMLRLRLEHTSSTSEKVSLVIRRGRFAVSNDPEWTDLLQDPEVLALRQELDDLAEQRDAIASVDIPVMQEAETEHQRRTFSFIRGNWLDRDAEVEPGVPSLFASLHEDLPRNRLGLAKWLVSPENPLTARVAVNRFWQELFGIGLVETAEDFGSSGTPPSHPALLDHLALRFQNEHQWSVKKLLREIVLSSTYGQDAKVTADHAERDPRNRLLARGPRNRISAEMVRDQALAVSGLLSEKMYGPPVMPPQPDGVWRVIYSNAEWVTPENEDRYRRAVYTYWRRTTAYPSMLTFDAPSREVCSARRINTNTPLQALVALNDPVYMECAQALGKRMEAEGGNELLDKLSYGFELAAGSPPNSKQLETLTKLYQVAVEEFVTDPESAAAVAANKHSYAMTTVASAILNLDCVLTK